MLRPLILISFFASLVGCTPSNTTQTTHPYWDSKAYFESEITRLHQEQVTLQKQLEFDGQSQTVDETKPDWTKELDVFLTIDLHKPIYRGRLDVDTLNVNDSTFQIRYSTTDQKLDLTLCTITLSIPTNAVQEITVKYQSTNSLYASTKTFLYKPNQFYKISGQQEVSLGKGVEYTIKGSFISQP
jgi:hypothetical protein